MAGPLEKRKGDTIAAQLTWPASRGTDALTAGIGPCQGWNIGYRIEYPMSGGQVGIAMTSNIKNVQYSYSTSENPQSQSDFKEFGNVLTKVAKGTRCTPGPDLSNTGVKSGDLITLQFKYDSGPKNATRYECADLIVVDNAQFAAMNYTTGCTNTVTSTNIQGGKANPQLLEAQAAKANEEDTESKEGLTATEAGLTGAFAATGLFLVVMALGWYLGIMRFGRNRSTQRKDTHQTASVDVKSVASL